jgi:hypothetical protein
MDDAEMIRILRAMGDEDNASRVARGEVRGRQREAMKQKLAIVDRMLKGDESPIVNEPPLLDGEGRPIKRLSDGRELPMVREFRDGFEDVETVAELHDGSDLFRWHQVAQVPNPRVAQLGLSRDVYHSGAQSLVATARSDGGITKASIFTTGLHFVKGDDFWFSGWFLVEGGANGLDLMLVDVESTRTYIRGYPPEQPGRRLHVHGDTISVEFGKWFRGRRFVQDTRRPIPFPRGRWVNVKLHMKLSEAPDGQMQVFQDGTKIIDARGRTLPTADAVYDVLEIGITSHRGRATQRVFVDDVVVSSSPL